MEHSGCRGDGLGVDSSASWWLSRVVLAAHLPFWGCCLWRLLLVEGGAGGAPKVRGTRLASPTPISFILSASTIRYQVKERLGLPRWLSGKASACQAGDVIEALSWEDPLEKEMATHSNLLAWEIPMTEEPGRLQSMGSNKSWTKLRD